MSRTIHIVALGCPKNQVDTERMARLALDLGLQPVTDPAAAEVILVNTCAFIQQAVEESIQTVLELARLKEHGRASALVVVGCLVQRHAAELARELPEVDHFLGPADLPGLRAVLAGQPADRVVTASRTREEDAQERFPRAPCGPGHWAYLKIAEGCDRACAFCVIPALRGPQRSRSVASLVREANLLSARGVRELVLVAQDSTAYGQDLSPPALLADLLRALDGVKELRWVRLMYAYPSAVDSRLIRALASVPRVVPYLDLPFQHIDDQVLRRMRRGYTGNRVRRVIDDLRGAVCGIHLRATLLCGHPGETPAAHRALGDFLARTGLDHVGVFAFSPEAGTAAASDADQVPRALAEERAAELMEIQRSVSRRRLRRLRGSTLEVVVDGVSEQSDLLLQGRHPGQAPEVDGVVHLSDVDWQVQAGDLLRARVTGADDHDLVASAAECKSNFRRGP